jgi:hypothetical protein
MDEARTIVCPDTTRALESGFFLLDFNSLEPRESFVPGIAPMGRKVVGFHRIPYSNTPCAYVRQVTGGNRLKHYVPER